MKSASQKGFTLIEILAVIAIIGYLASVVLTSVNQARDKARIARAEIDVRQLRQAIGLLVDDTGEWPGHKSVDVIEPGAPGNEIWDLTVPLAGIVATDGAYPNWRGPYIRIVVNDPWGNNYFFDTDYDTDLGAGENWAVVIGSFGPNGDGQNVYDTDNIIEIFVSE